MPTYYHLLLVTSGSSILGPIFFIGTDPPGCGKGFGLGAGSHGEHEILRRVLNQMG
jgi:hypothetical protein